MMEIVFRPCPRQRAAIRSQRGGGFYQGRLNGENLGCLGKRAAQLENADGELFRFIPELICLF
jgi:hypothetical protein